MLKPAEKVQVVKKLGTRKTCLECHEEDKDCKYICLCAGTGTARRGVPQITISLFIYFSKYTSLQWNRDRKEGRILGGKQPAYTSQIHEMVERGAVKKLSKDEMNSWRGPVWYMSH